MPRLPLPLTLLALAAVAPLAAQSVHWQPPGGTLPVGEVSQLQLVFEDCSPDDTPATPKVDGLRIDYQGSSSNISIINGSFSRSVQLTYSVLLARQQDVEIPAFSIDTNKGRLRVPAAHFSPSGATLGSTGVTLSDAASSRMTPSSSSVWAGQVFDLAYTIDVAAGYYPTWGRGIFDWDPSPLVAEDWSQPEPFETQGASPRTGLAYHTRAIAGTAGRIRLKPTSQLINLSVGVTGFGFFQQRQYQQFAVGDTPPTLEVRPLPPAPAEFNGAVGDFKISSKIVPTHVKVGEPVTWTIELTGSGNWPQIRGLPAREAPADFQVIQPKPKRTQPQGRLFEGTLSEDVVLVPTHAGSYELPALTFAYFDPASGSYRSVVAPGATVTAEPAGPPPPAGPGVAAAPGVPQVSATQAAPEAKAPELPTGGLGDALAPSARAQGLLPRRELGPLAAAPFVLLALSWAVAAYRRARATDPLRPLRQARVRLASTLDALAAAPSSARAPLLLSWQRDSALLFGVAHAAPPPHALPDAPWSLLWSEADRCLYGSGADLPADWVARARSALAGRTLRSFQPLSLFKPRNLLPFLAALAALALPARGAPDPASLYRAGDFAGAERAWSARVSADPLDAFARHNLALCLAQQDRWGEAAAQASVAFVQDPSSEALRRLAVATSDKAGFVVPPVDTLLAPGPEGSLARLEPPGGWQRAAVLCAAVLALGLALAAAPSYGLGSRRWLLPAAWAALVAALALGTASWIGFRAYGTASDPCAVVAWRAGLLRSIPTEADVSQKTTALAAGSTAIADKTFLGGWVRLRFPNGETGWVARSEVIYFWQPPPG